MQRESTERQAAAGLDRRVPTQMRMCTRRQWRVAGWAWLISLLVLGGAGETLPGASQGRVVPVAWWNYVTLIASPVLIGLIAATFVPYGQPKSSRVRGATGASVGGVLGTVAMACPVCNPIAIPLFGAAGVVSFLSPVRGVIALLSIVLLAVTLAVRLRATRTCQVTSKSDPGDEAGTRVETTAA
jgi:hypothetical protein